VPSQHLELRQLYLHTVWYLGYFRLEYNNLICKFIFVTARAIMYYIAPLTAASRSKLKNWKTDNNLSRTE